MAQLADLYLWPICMGGYHASNRPYQRLTDDGKLIDCHIKEDERPMLGSKYSCFEKCRTEGLKTQKASDVSIEVLGDRKGDLVGQARPNNYRTHDLLQGIFR
ncbi:hypothetical protein ACOJBM_40810 [Rhizobium beringeri]